MPFSGLSSTNHGSYTGSSVATVNTPPACVFMSVGLHDAGTTTDSLALDSGAADDSGDSDDSDSEDAGDSDDSVADDEAALDSGVDCAVADDTDDSEVVATLEETAALDETGAELVVPLDAVPVPE